MGWLWLRFCRLFANREQEVTRAGKLAYNETQKKAGSLMPDEALARAIASPPAQKLRPRKTISMKLFQCQVCSQPLFFENALCEKCGHRLGFDPKARQLMALEPAGGDLWQEAQPGAASRWRFCTNATQGVCNWLVPHDSAQTLCVSCRHNRMIPDLAEPQHLERWRRIESAKHRLIYTLLALDLPLPTRAQDAKGLAFDILASAQGGPPVMTGHEDGLVTLNLGEADDGEREKRRTDMGETYRTLLGHVRHEIGHFYWERLVRDGGRIEAFRSLFGDERADYASALQRHYAQGPAPDWQMHYVSTYASAHPWEDFAETFAHYLHIVDTLETANAFGLEVHPRIRAAADISSQIDVDAHHARDIGHLIDAWLPLCFAVNSLNRSMGQPDLYPFVLSPQAIAKLGFVQELVHRPPQAPEHFA